MPDTPATSPAALQAVAATRAALPDIQPPVAIAGAGNQVLLAWRGLSTPGAYIASIDEQGHAGAGQALPMDSVHALVACAPGIVAAGGRGTNFLDVLLDANGNIIRELPHGPGTDVRVPPQPLCADNAAPVRIWVDARDALRIARDGDLARVPLDGQTWQLAAVADQTGLTLLRTRDSVSRLELSRIEFPDSAAAPVAIDDTEHAHAPLLYAASSGYMALWADRGRRAIRMQRFHRDLSAAGEAHTLYRAGGHRAISWVRGARRDDGLLVIGWRERKPGRAHGLGGDATPVLIHRMAVVDTEGMRLGPISDIAGAAESYFVFAWAGPRLITVSGGMTGAITAFQTAASTPPSSGHAP